MSNVAPVSAVLVIRWTASAATSAGPTTRPIGSVARSSSRRVLELVAQQRRRQRRVDEARGDEVDPHRRELQRERRRERRQHRGGRRHQPEALPDLPAAGAAHEHQRAAGRHLGGGAPCDVQRHHDVVGQRVAHLVGVHLQQGHVVRPARGDQHVVDPVQPVEEPLQRGGVGGVQGRRVLGADLGRGWRSRSGSRPTRTTSAPSERARRAVSRPIPALPPIRTTVCPASSLVMTLLPRDLGAQRLHGRVVDPREAGEGLDRVAEHHERHVRADGQRRLLQPLARLRPDRVGAGQPFTVAEQGEEPGRLGVGVRVGGGLGHVRQRVVALYRSSVTPTAAACGSV